MALDPLLVIRMAIAIPLIFVLPGLALTFALWPRGRAEGPDGIERAYLSVALSVALTIVIGALLGFLPHGERGFFRVPLVVAILLGVTAVSLVVARQRAKETRAPPPDAVASLTRELRPPQAE